MLGEDGASEEAIKEVDLEEEEEFYMRDQMVALPRINITTIILVLVFTFNMVASFTICGVDIPNARASAGVCAMCDLVFMLLSHFDKGVIKVAYEGLHSYFAAESNINIAPFIVASRALEDIKFPESFPLSRADLTPEWSGNDGAFYFLPKLVQHAGDGCRKSLSDFYARVLPPASTGTTLDLCSSWTSHYPVGYKASRGVALGLNYVELALNPSKTELCVQDLNKNPALPYDDGTFDIITNSLSVDYMTSPLELFSQMHRVLKPGGLACMAFTNRCFPTKVVPAWTRPFTEESHARIVASYYHYSADWGEIGIADISPPGWEGERDPCIVVMGRK